MRKKKSLFITFEGIEGSGKSYQSRKLFRRIKDAKLPAIYTREPGGTKLAEKIRELVQNDSLRESISQNALDAVKNKENWGERARVILSDFKKIKTT